MPYYNLDYRGNLLLLFLYGGHWRVWMYSQKPIFPLKTAELSLDAVVKRAIFHCSYKCDV